MVETENEHEGYNRAVKEVLTKCKNDSAFGKNIFGAVASLIEVPSKYENAIEMIAQDATHNPNGIIQTQNMDDYLNRFSEEEKPKIASLLNENELKYACR